MSSVPAQAGRGKDVRLQTETRYRRCLEPVCWTLSSSIRHEIKLKSSLAQGNELVGGTFIKILTQSLQVGVRSIEMMSPQVPSAHSETASEFLAIRRTKSLKNNCYDCRTIGNSSILLLRITEWTE